MMGQPLASALVLNIEAQTQRFELRNRLCKSDFAKVICKTEFHGETPMRRLHFSKRAVKRLHTDWITFLCAGVFDLRLAASDDIHG